MKGIRRQNKKRKISIRFKMLALLLAVMVLLCGAMAAIMYRNVRKALEKEAGIEMNLFCRDRGMEINSQLLRIEDSISISGVSILSVIFQHNDIAHDRYSTPSRLCDLHIGHPLAHNHLPTLTAYVLNVLVLS